MRDRLATVVMDSMVEFLQSEFSTELYQCECLKERRGGLLSGGLACARECAENKYEIGAIGRSKRYKALVLNAKKRVEPIWVLRLHQIPL